MAERILLTIRRIEVESRLAIGTLYKADVYAPDDNIVRMELTEEEFKAVKKALVEVM